MPRNILQYTISARHLNLTGVYFVVLRWISITHLLRVRCRFPSGSGDCAVQHWQRPQVCLQIRQSFVIKQALLRDLQPVMLLKRLRSFVWQTHKTVLLVNIFRDEWSYNIFAFANRRIVVWMADGVSVKSIELKKIEKIIAEWVSLTEFYRIPDL